MCDMSLRLDLANTPIWGNNYNFLTSRSRLGEVIEVHLRDDYAQSHIIYRLLLRCEEISESSTLARSSIGDFVNLNVVMRNK